MSDQLQSILYTMTTLFEYHKQKREEDHEREMEKLRKGIELSRTILEERKKAIVELNRFCKEKEDRIEELGYQLDVAKSEIADLKTITASNNEEISRYSKENANLNSEIATLRARIAELELKQIATETVISDEMIETDSEFAAIATTKIDSFHLKSLGENPTKVDIIEWINNSRSDQYKRQRALIALNEFTELVDKTEIETIIQEASKSADPNIKKHSEFLKEYEIISEKFLTIQQNKVQPTIWTLFAYYLPARRSDIYNLEIVDSISSDINGNYWCKQNSTFYWSKYKTADRYGVQKLDPTELMDILPSILVKMAIEFLNEQPTGRLFKIQPSTCAKRIIKELGFNNNSFRHFWTTWATKNLNRIQSATIAKWMAHSPAIAATVYRI